jgi:hypothetical protein
MITLDISNYESSFTYLNGQSTLRVKPIDLARGIVTVGQGSWNDVFNLGLFRIGELICKAFAFTKLENGNLVLQDRFYKLNQSEKVTVSYYIGQGLTKLYAEENLKLKWLFHVDDFENISFHEKGKAISKINIGRSDKKAARPDLIGLEGFSNIHIFEAKGRSIGYNVNEMQHAINQVSQIVSCNGHPPLTRTACYFDLSTSPINGIIIDPENDGNGITLDFNEKNIITRFYSFFKEYSRFFTNEISVNKYKFLMTPVGVPNIFFGFDKRILKLETPDLINEDLYTIDDFNNFRELGQNFSIGLDGIIIMNK